MASGARSGPAGGVGPSTDAGAVQILEEDADGVEIDQSVDHGVCDRFVEGKGVESEEEEYRE